MNKYRVTPDQALAHLQEKRPNVMLEFSHQKKALVKYYHYINPSEPYPDLKNNEKMTKKLYKNIKLVIKLIQN